MSRALVTFGVGPHEELLKIARPGFEAFAERHGYDLVVRDASLAGAQALLSGRPPSWGKVTAVYDALDVYDEALWVDADVVIADATGDVVVAGDAWQALVRHHTADGEVPNCGVWLVRRPMRRVLLDLWAMTRYVEHPWWEQAALHELLGYRGRPVRLASPTPLYEMTEWLDAGWNVHPRDLQTCEWPRFLHATTLPDRAKVMRRWARTAVAA